MSLKVFVLDSFAVLALLEDQVGADRVSEIIADAGAAKYMSVVNLGEVLYVIERGRSKKAAIEVKAAMIDTDEIKLVGVDIERVAAAASIKARGGISYADCFAVALAKEIDGTIVTGDREFAKAASEVSIEWLA